MRLRIRAVGRDRRRLAKVIDPKSGTEDLPQLTDPLVVVAFEGWNDAGDAATGAVEHLELSWDNGKQHDSMDLVYVKPAG